MRWSRALPWIFGYCTTILCSDDLPALSLAAYMTPILYLYVLADSCTRCTSFTMSPARPHKTSTRSRMQRSDDTYNSVHALLITWESSNTEAFTSQANQLGTTLRDYWNFSVHPLHIPSLNSQDSLHFQVQSFLQDYGQPDNLIIIYYGGHNVRVYDEYYKPRLQLQA